jgi:non-specific protein-tyrosine kinase
MEAILRILESMADVVILDSPPVLAVADASILAGHDTSVVLVIRAGKTSAQAARLAADAIIGVQGRLLGAVVNGVKRAPFISYGSWHLSPGTKGRLDAAEVQPETAGG